MASKVTEIAGVQCLVADADGPMIVDSDGARDLIGEAMAEGASMIAVPVAQLDASFFQLRSGLAGEVLQKAANYRLRFAVVGDIAAYVEASDALRDFVVESNRGRSIFFVADLAELEEKLKAVGVAR